MNIIDGKANFSQKEGTIVIVKEGFICLDKQSDLKAGDWYWDKYAEQVSNNSTENGRRIANQIKSHPLIVASNFKLEGVPLLMKRSNVSHIAEEWYVKKNNFEEVRNTNDGKRIIERGIIDFVEGYNTHAETHPFTEEDVRNAMISVMGWYYGHDGLRLEEHIEKYVQQLRQPQIPERLVLDVKYPKPQKYGLETEYEDGTIIRGSWASRIEQHSKLNNELKSDNGIIYY